MKICIAHHTDSAREVISRGLAFQLQAQVTGFSCVENVLVSSLDYDIFIVYNNFHKKMNGVRGAQEIRMRKPKAFIIGVSAIPNYHLKFLPAGADAFLLKSGNEISELVTIIRHYLNGQVISIGAARETRA